MKKMTTVKKACNTVGIHVRHWLYAMPVDGRADAKPGGKEVIVEFVLMVVAVAVGYLFKDQIKTLISSLGSNVSEKITAMFTSS